jgi:hypothetical protein
MHRLGTVGFLGVEVVERADLSGKRAMMNTRGFIVVAGGFSPKRGEISRTLTNRLK